MGVFIQVDYTDIEGTPFKIEIADPDYTDGIITQVQGKATLSRPKVKTMDMLRGSTLKMQLLADTTNDYYKRLIETVGDKKLTVTFYKDGDVYWNGFIKPDGIVESFVTDRWIIIVQAVDGLGFIDNISFLNEDGNKYQGNLSEIDILKRCLVLTGQTMNFRVYYMNLFYTVDEDAPILTNTALKTTYVNTDRYVNDDQESTVFTVKEVMQSLLKKYGAFITQEDNIWHIVRLKDYFTTDTSIEYWEYDLDSSAIGSFTVDHRTSLGSHIDDYDPCHSGGNQQKNYKSALGAYKVYYEYGFRASILNNYKLYANDDLGDIDGWTISNINYFNFNLIETGVYQIIFKSYEGSYSDLTNAITSDDSNTINGGEIINLTINLSINQNNRILQQYCRIIFKGISGTDYYLNENGEWTLSSTNLRVFYYNRHLVIQIEFFASRLRKNWVQNLQNKGCSCFV